ncbi:DUF3243 domain-containing protein [Gorillibacterium massiliense]|uniref:DUF3243 domain-containing protein n=1 Tax=Gorillibacterium massiliense TaxID=1280390 RepID=UPI0004B459EC|nr:DUF3243 domain-containing protein [Gorillibacterium massiliense]
MATVLESYAKWKKFLSERVSAAERSGMSEETIIKMAKEIGDFLASKIDPQNKEEGVLKELWEAADEEEKKVLAKVIFRTVS